MVPQIVDGGALGRLHMIHIREHRFPFLLKVQSSLKAVARAHWGLLRARWGSNGFPERQMDSQSVIFSL